MKAFCLGAVVLAAVLAAACGPSRAVRTEPADISADQTGVDASALAMRSASAVLMQGVPGPLTVLGGTIWVSLLTQGDSVLLQAVKPDGTVQRTPFSVAPFSAETTIASTPGTVWVLVTPAQGHSQLLRVGTPFNPIRTDYYAPTTPVRASALALPRKTQIVGANSRAVWLLSETTSGYTLWRRDARTSTVSRFDLPSIRLPGVAVTPTHVFVLLQKGPVSELSIQTRDPAGRITAESRPLRFHASFRANPLAACGNRIFGGIDEAGSAALFQVAADGVGLSYSETLPPRPGPSKLTGIALSDDCNSLWAVTVRADQGVLSHFETSPWHVIGQTATSYMRWLLWADESLWASDPAHAAVLRIR